MSDNSPVSIHNNSTDYNTDYGAGMLANSDKLIPEDRRSKYDKMNKSEKFEILKKIDEQPKESDEDFFNDAPAPQSEHFLNNKTFATKHVSEKDDIFIQPNTANKYNDGKTKLTEMENNFAKSEVQKKEESEQEEEEEYNNLSSFKQKQKKLMLLAEMGELSVNRGVKFTKQYGINSDYFEMKHEFDFHNKIINKSNAVSWMSGLLLTTVEGVELLSDNYGDRVGVNLHGWKSRMNSQIDSIMDVLGKLYVKHNKMGSAYSPELQFMFIILSTMLGTQLTNMNKKKNSNTSVNKQTANDIDILREKAKQDSSNNVPVSNKISSEHDNANKEMENFRNLRNMYSSPNINLNEMQQIREQFDKNNRNTEVEDDNIRSELKNIRETLKNDKETNSNKSKSSSNDSSQNKSKNKSMYSKKSYKRGAGIVIK